MWKPLLSRHILKTLRGSSKGKVQRKQYLLAVGLYRMSAGDVIGFIQTVTTKQQRGQWADQCNLTYVSSTASFCSFIVMFFFPFNYTTSFWMPNNASNVDGASKRKIFFLNLNLDVVGLETSFWIMRIPAWPSISITLPSRSRLQGTSACILALFGFYHAKVN